MMKYPKEYLEEIKQRLKVSQVVGKSVKLKRRGKEFIGLSPFSKTKIPVGLIFLRLSFDVWVKFVFTTKYNS